MVYRDDTRLFPLFYVGASGETTDTVITDELSVFLQTEFRPIKGLAVNSGIRYDLDTSGNNPGFSSPAMLVPRGRDGNNIQPRAGFSWDVTGDGRHVLRGGAGVFTGRMMLPFAHIERMQNGFTGRIIQQRISGAAIGLPQLAIDPSNPGATGVPLPRDALRNADNFNNPYSTQVTTGYTRKVGASGMFADFEGIYVKGRNEPIVRDTNWKGNAAGGGRLNPAFTQINTYTNEGRSEYRAFVASLNGTVRGHLLTASVTVASKKNINDDFQPAFTDYPSAPADIQAEWGRSRGDERVRFVAS